MKVKLGRSPIKGFEKSPKKGKGSMVESMEGKPSNGSNLEPNKFIKEVSDCKSSGKSCEKGHMNQMS
jgi:hypothetical protein